MKLKELYSELKNYKNSRIDFYIADVQKMIKGYLKNTETENEDNPENLVLSIQEIKSDEEVLKKYSCKSAGEKKQDKKDRTKIELKGFNELTSIDRRIINKNVTFKLNFLQEEFGIIVYL